LRISRIGTAVRGAATNAERASSLGINVRSLSSVVWAISGLLSGIAALTVLMNDGFGAPTGPEVLIPALAAAVVARMSSIPVAVAAALGLSVLQAATSWSYQNSPVAVAYLVVIAAALLVQRGRGGRSEEGPTSSWEATKEIRPVPAELDRVPGIRRARIALVVVVLVLLAVYPFASSNAQTSLGSLIFIQALIGLSLVVLTGWGGQVSLGQFALVAIAAVLGGHLTADSGITFWLTLPFVAAVTAGLAAALGVPALRIRGSFLAVTTLAFAVATQYLLFDTEVFRGLIPTRVYRPGFLFVSFASERSYYFLCLGFLVTAAFVVSRLRRSRPGRVLIALRENEAGVQAFGVPAGRTRIAAFALSGALCGTAGVLFVHHQRAVDAVSFGSVVSVEMFIMAMIGGVTSVAGALLGAAYVGIANFLLPSEVARNLVTSGGLLALLFIAPGGLAALAAGARDAVLRIVATRRQIPVPSLFADMDYEAIRSQRAPLVEPIPYHGLEAIPGNRRYTGHSELHGRPRARDAEGVRA
jgi:branched-chain amino acid transport system permease protein